MHPRNRHAGRYDFAALAKSVPDLAPFVTLNPSKEATTLISKSANLPVVLKALRRVKPADTRILEMSQGQKKSRVVAWTFLGKKQREEWRRRRWAQGRELL